MLCNNQAGRSCGEFYSVSHITPCLLLNCMLIIYYILNRINLQWREFINRAN